MTSSNEISLKMKNWLRPCARLITGAVDVRGITAQLTDCTLIL